MNKPTERKFAIKEPFEINFTYQDTETISILPDNIEVTMLAGEKAIAKFLCVDVRETKTGFKGNASLVSE